MEIEREEREATWESKRSLVNWNSFGGILYYSYNRSQGFSKSIYLSLGLSKLEFFAIFCTIFVRLFPPKNSIGKKPE